MPIKKYNGYLQDSKKAKVLLIMPLLIGITCFIYANQQEGGMNALSTLILPIFLIILGVLIYLAMISKSINN